MRDIDVAKCPPKAVLPVIFVPGIMGSRLEKSNGTIVWDPPTTGQPRDSTRATDPQIRQEDLLSPVWQDRPGNPAIFPGPPSEGDTRGQFHKRAQDEVQGALSGAVEWGLMDGLERRERLIGAAGAPFKDDFLRVNLGSKAKFSSRLGPDIIDMALSRGWGGCVWEFYGGFLRWLHYEGSAAICPGATVKLEVWAHPYNWTDDNRNSGQKLAGIVEKAYSEARQKYAGNSEYPVLKPVVITHSMGGLVARAYAKHFGGADACHAMIHGAMPTQGAPAAYKRMRAGFEGKSKVVLGWNGAEVTAVLGNSPGGLELLPSQLHKTADNGRQWLFPRGEAYLGGGILEDRRLPAADPYAEIYRNRTDWWRLLNADWVNPGKGDGYAFYLPQLEKAQAFHDDLGSYFHPNTRMFYSKDYSSWDRVEIKSLVRQTDGTSVYDFGSEMIASPSAPGDGTVHTGSAESLPADVECLFSNLETGADFNFTHEAAYSKREVRHQIAIWLNEIVWEQMA